MSTSPLVTQALSIEFARHRNALVAAKAEALLARSCHLLEKAMREARDTTSHATLVAQAMQELAKYEEYLRDRQQW